VHERLLRATIGIGAGLAARPLPHHRAYGSVHGGSDRLPDRANRWKSKRSEVTIGQRNVQRRATTQAPYTVRRTHGLGGKVSGHSPRDQFPESGPAQFPLLPEETAKTPTNPFIQFPKHAGRFRRNRSRLIFQFVHFCASFSGASYLAEPREMFKFGASAPILGASILCLIRRFHEKYDG
jgi:hypothetical protein